MYSLYHSRLFKYPQLLKNSEIKKIEIDKNDVSFHYGNFKVFCDSKDFRSFPLEIINFNNYEKNIILAINKFIKKSKNVLDIGANIGFSTLKFKEINNNLNILAFEPQVSMYKLMVKNIRTNNIKNVKVYNFGLSNENQKHNFHSNINYPGNGSIKKLQPKLKTNKKMIKFIKGDNLIKNKIDFIKIDTEGSELLVLKGLEKTIKKYKPVILCEILNKWTHVFNINPNEIILYLHNFGYGFFGIGKNGKLVKLKKITDKTIYNNFLFIDKSRSI